MERAVRSQEAEADSEVEKIHKGFIVLCNFCDVDALSTYTTFIQSAINVYTVQHNCCDQTPP